MSAYQAPSIETIGTLHELTLDLIPKDSTDLDGFVFAGIPTGTVPVSD